MVKNSALKNLAQQLNGTLHFSKLMRTIYATDASIYKQFPLAVAYPKTVADIQKLVAFAEENSSSLIPRTAGTSLAGQCVGDGIVIDVSKHFTQILELNKNEKWVRVQPGVIRDELNDFLKPHGLFFGPNTSTANRCMMGGMVGNNSSGTTSIKYGVTRDKVLSLNCILSDGSEAIFNAVAEGENPKTNNPKQDQIYNDVLALLNEDGAREKIEKHFPKKEIHRRNTGYAIDVLAAQKGELDLTKLLSGSEGTLAFTTEIKLKLDDLPPKNVSLVCAHFNSIKESMEAVSVAMKAQPYACELMDKFILDATKKNIAQAENRFFVEGDPAAVLVVELRSNSENDLQNQVEKLVAELEKTKLGFAFPVVSGNDATRVWALRAAGLGLLSNVPGNAKPIACIEDTAVDVNDLPAYIAEFEKTMESFEQKAVYYAHAGAGELHLRPIINLKDEADRIKFRQICEASARLVKKYNGSLSGEHGDGRVRAEFIPLMVGENNYKRLQRIKQIWDPNNIFNPGKIVDAKPIDEDLRFEVNQENPVINTVFEFEEGLLQSTEKCNGSADCRKLTGAMCPSYQATKNETETTRARANMLREVILENRKTAHPLASEDLKQVLDLCVSCKACKRECPSNVDMAMMKAEFLYQYHQKNGLDFRSRIFGNIHKQNRLGMLAPTITNFVFTNKILSGFLKNMMGVAPQRNLPLLNKTTFRKWLQYFEWTAVKPTKSVYLFIDEFTNYNDLELGKKTVSLLYNLGYEVKTVAHRVSGRTYISKGMLDQARACAEENVAIFSNLVSEEISLVGIEPSAILSFRDEYPKLLRSTAQTSAKALAKNCLTIEEFLHCEHAKKSLSHFFTEEKQEVKLHVHCHQKALSKPGISKAVLGIPKNFTVTQIGGGCCGMAGSFGYEKEHYETSMQMGELTLFPAVRSANTETIIAASGTSCRHQIADGTQKQALHPVEVLYNSLGEVMNSI